MKSHILVFLAFLFMASPFLILSPNLSYGCSEAGLEKKVNEVVARWHNAAAQSDDKQYLDLLDSHAVFLGTDETERWDLATLQKVVLERFSKKQGWVFKTVKRHVSISPRCDVAWFDESLRSDRLGALRGSGVLVQRDSGWKILQYNLTFTVPNERFESIKPLLKNTN